MGAGGRRDVELPAPLIIEERHFYCSNRFMKKWIIRGAIVAVVLVVAGIVAVFYFLNDIVKSGVETAGPQLTKGELRLTKANLSPFSGLAQITGLFVGNPQGWKSESAVKVGDVKVMLNVGSALSDVVVIDSIHIQAPEITYETGLGGSNLGKILENIEAVAGGADKKSDAATTSTPGKKFRVKDIQINGARVHLAALGKQITVPLADIRLQNIGTDGSGVTAAELTRDILKPLLASVMKAAAESATGLTRGVKDLGQGALTNQLDKAAGGLKGLLNKK
jgi:uncharacterized protein involved in outer membrane biogenesis